MLTELECCSCWDLQHWSVRLSVWSPAVSALRCSVGCGPRSGTPSHQRWDARPSQPGMTERANTMQTFILRDPIAVEPQNRQQCGGRSPTLRHLSWLPSSRPSLTRVDSYPFLKPRFAAGQSFVAYATKLCHRSSRIAAGGARPVAGPEALWGPLPAERGRARKTSGDWDVPPGVAHAPRVSRVTAGDGGVTQGANNVAAHRCAGQGPKSKSQGGGNGRRGKVRRPCPVDRRSLRGGFNNGWKGCSARSHSQTRPRPLRASVLSDPLVVSTPPTAAAGQ